MFRALFLCLSALAFTSQVLALGFNFTGVPTNITLQQLLDVPAGVYLSNCQSPCGPLNTTVAACTNDACLCTAAVSAQLTTCEQCMFNELVAANMKQPDPRVGTNVGLAAYQAACGTAANVTLPALALAIAPGWEGPTDIILNTPATVVVVGFGAILGGSALLLLSNI
ncbi:hypothetical protein EW145_g1843 [Phellinidium pouzarii]|uniref:Extracellular membrane protein CFEM domain-containing protein n=1 Tax=Phellinidium pouzarii TaxID=167371 RepID=A0A4S4LCY8_9AGAM|nr:hypothetical protein EW145_g1843 [Phellinidium pouzarii]